ncbi:hypothetical protein L914_17775, partial [Phytophthora nicotianae]
QRAIKGLPALCPNKKLHATAQRPSDDMAAKNCMAMTDDGSIISECITQGGYDWRPRMWPQTPITPLTPLEVDVVLRGQEGR